MIQKYFVLFIFIISCSPNTDDLIDEVASEISTTTSSIFESQTTTSVLFTTSTTTTTTTTIPKKIFISLDHPSEREDIPSTNQGYGDFIERLPGYEGDAIENLEIRLAINELPDPFRTILKEEILVVNGCHPYGKVYSRDVFMVYLIHSVMTKMVIMEMIGLFLYGFQIEDYSLDS